MDPVPDCGENSYRGSGKLTGKRAIITGADSGIGRATPIYVLLASDDASYISGARVAVTGGRPIL